MDTNSAPNTFPPPEPPPPATAPGPAPHPARRTRHAGHIVAIVIGCLLLLPGLGMTAGGGFAALGQLAVTDDDGYFEFTLDRLETEDVAIAATELWLDGDTGDADWLLDWLDVDVRLRVDGARSTDVVFVGIARADDVERYLRDAAYAEIVEVDGRTPRYRTVTGTRSIAPPLDQDFWSASAAGDGVQELEWAAQGGRWAVVVMNADGSPTVTADVQVAARSGALMPIAITLLVAGGLVTITAVVLIVLGARGRRSPADSADERPLPPPAATSDASTEAGLPLSV